MTSSEAAAKPHVVRAIALKAGADKRTVMRCLRGESPCSKVWDKVVESAAVLGVEALPEPPVRRPRPARACPDCAGLRDERDFSRGEVATLRGIVAELRARVAVLEAASAPSAEALRADAPITPCGRDEKVQVVQVRQPAPRLAAVPPSRQRKRCHVILEMPPEPGEATG